MTHMQGLLAAAAAEEAWTVAAPKVLTALKAMIQAPLPMATSRELSRASSRLLVLLLSCFPPALASR